MQVPTLPRSRLLRIYGRAPDQLLFELGVRPGAVPLGRYPARCGSGRGALSPGEGWVPHHRIEPVA